ncbi:AraC family transcriptional regulator [Nonomuraea fuscirosea]
MDVLSDAVTAMRNGRPHASRTRMHGSWGIRFPPTPGAGFHVILQGSCHLLPVGGEPVRLGVGDVAFLPRELGHGLADAPTTPLVEAVPRDEDGSPIGTLRRDGPGPVTEMLCGAYRLDQVRVHPLLAELPDVIHIPARIGRHPSLRGAVELLGLELGASPGPGSDAATTALLDVLLLYILRAWYESRPPDQATGWGAALRDPAVTAALRAIHRHPARPWTVRSLAERAGLSRTAFAQRFAGKVGLTPLAYLTWWRMTTAARLLRGTDLPLRSVAERTGYATEFAFAKAFKREFGTAPGRFRDGLDGSPAAAAHPVAGPVAG